MFFFCLLSPCACSPAAWWPVQICMPELHKLRQTLLNFVSTVQVTRIRMKLNTCNIYLYINIIWCIVLSSFLKQHIFSTTLLQVDTLEIFSHPRASEAVGIATCSNSTWSALRRCWPRRNCFNAFDFTVSAVPWFPSSVNYESIIQKNIPYSFTVHVIEEWWIKWLNQINE